MSQPSSARRTDLRACTRTCTAFPSHQSRHRPSSDRTMHTLETDRLHLNVTASCWGKMHDGSEGWRRCDRDVSRGHAHPGDMTPDPKRCGERACWHYSRPYIKPSRKGNQGKGGRAPRSNEVRPPSCRTVCGSGKAPRCTTTAWVAWLVALLAAFIDDHHRTGHARACSQQPATSEDPLPSIQAGMRVQGTRLLCRLRPDGSKMRAVNQSTRVDRQRVDCDRRGGSGLRSIEATAKHGWREAIVQATGAILRQGDGRPMGLGHAHSPRPPGGFVATQREATACGAFGVRVASVLGSGRRDGRMQRQTQAE